MEITVFEVFELNRIMNSILSQQLSYEINTAFKIYELVKWLEDTEKFVFGRMKLLYNGEAIDFSNPTYKAMLGSKIQFVTTTLTTDELRNTLDKVELSVIDVEILEKFLGKTKN